MMSILSALWAVKAVRWAVVIALALGISAAWGYQVRAKRDALAAAAAQIRSLEKQIEVAQRDADIAAEHARRREAELAAKETEFAAYVSRQEMDDAAAPLSPAATTPPACRCADRVRDSRDIDSLRKFAR